MPYNFSQFEAGADGAVDWLKKEYAGLRTGRATTAILDAVLVEAYGSRTPINQLANINLEGPQTVRIVPWDQNIGKSIESAIAQSNLGLSVSTDEKGLRVNFPSLTSERRAELVKVGKQKLEESRIRVRQEREKVQADIEKREKGAELGKDDAFRAKQELQKLVDNANRKLDELFESKEKEISA